VGSDHGHRTAERFEFTEARHTRVFVCDRIAAGASILVVAHDPDGDWQFLCDGDHEAEGDGVQVACLECVVAGDASLNDVADMCAGWSASRGDLGAAWTRRDDLEETIRETVARVGWFVIGVGSDDDGPGFAYTIGLHRSYGHPELIIVGLRVDVMHALLNVCGERIKAGETLPLDAPFSDVLDDYDVLLRPVREPQSYREHVGYALWFNGGPAFPLLQLVWPDKDGRFPGDPDAWSGLATQQPLLP
jgi:hypothetical protein